jgi:hypothetical protein
MPTSRFDKFLPLAGILAAVVFVVIGFHPNPPGVGAGAHERVQWYLDHQAITAVSGFGAGYFAVLMVFFATGIRRVLRSGEAGESTYSSIALAGGILVAGSALLGALVDLGTLEAAQKHQDGVVTTLAFLNDFGWLPIIASLAVFYLGVGLGGLRTAALPKWLSVAAVVLGLACVLGPTGIAAWFATPVWMAVTGVVLLRRSTVGQSATPTDTRSPSYA